MRNASSRKSICASHSASNFRWSTCMSIHSRTARTIVFPHRHLDRCGAYTVLVVGQNCISTELGRAPAAPERSRAALRLADFCGSFAPHTGQCISLRASYRSPYTRGHAPWTDHGSGEVANCLGWVAPHVAKVTPTLRFLSNCGS
jgi:hypothetical protein